MSIANHSVLAINRGSSSVKLGLFTLAAGLRRFFDVALHLHEVADVSLRTNHRRRQIVDDVQDLEVRAKRAGELAAVIHGGV
jgi:acetate kinase